LNSKRTSFLKGLRVIDKFFQGKDPVHRSMRRLANRLRKAKIPYVVVGGMAVFARGYRRTTNDIDIILTKEGFAEFQNRFVPEKYELSPGRRRRFRDRDNDVTVDVLIAGFFPGRGNPGPISFPDPADVGETLENVRVVDLATLIQLKLAARRHQDFADVEHLIRANDLDETFGNRLHPSLHSDFVECLEEKRRQDKYDARNG
jgi:hypothetical protein